MRSGHAYQRPTSAPPNSGNGSGSWPTATAADSRSSGGNPNTTGTHGTTLTDRAVRMWPTPDASVINDGEQAETFLARQAALRERHGNNGMGTPLAMAVKLWPTPKASEGGPDYAKDERGLKPGGSRSLSLPTVASLWATPQARDTKGPFTGHRNGGKDLLGQARAFPSGHPDPTTPKPRSPDAMVLNPPFVEWLMGWPTGWTDCTRSATASYRSWLRVHSSTLRDVLASWR